MADPVSNVSEATAVRKSAWIPWVFVGSMAVVFAVNGALAWFAINSWSGLVSEDYFRQGVAYNKILRAAERQKALGWSVRMALLPDGDGKAPGSFYVRASYTDAAAAPLSGLRVRARLSRPTNEGYDRQTELRSSTPGFYRGRIDVPLPGQWDLRLIAADGNGNFHQWVKRIRVK